MDRLKILFTRLVMGVLRQFVPTTHPGVVSFYRSVDAIKDLQAFDRLVDRGYFTRPVAEEILRVIRERANTA